MTESIGPWQRLNRRVVYENEWITVYDDEVVRPDGEAGVYGVVHPKFLAVGIVALDADERVSSWVSTGTRSISSRGASLEEVSRSTRIPSRERSVSSRRKPAVPRPRGTSSHVSPSRTRSPMAEAWFLATGLSDGTPQLDGSEAGMTTRRIPFTEALEMVDSGEIHDVFTQMGLLAADRSLRRRS